MKWNSKFVYPKSTRSLVKGSRHYSLNGSSLPSVTTILSATKSEEDKAAILAWKQSCLLYTSPSPRDATLDRMTYSA